MSLPPYVDEWQVFVRGDVETFQDTSGTTPATITNDPLARWNDPRGGEPYLFQSTSGFRPFVVTNQINGLPCIRFGGDDFLNLSHTLIPVQRTMYAVIKVPSTGIYTLFCGDTSSLQWRIDNLKQRLVETNIADIGSSTTGISSGTWVQISASWDVQTRQGIFRSNKSDDGTVNGASGVNAEFPIIGMGKNFDSDSEFYLTDIALLMMGYGIHNTTKRQDVESWITNDWGV